MTTYVEATAQKEVFLAHVSFREKGDDWAPCLSVVPLSTSSFTHHSFEIGKMANPLDMFNKLTPHGPHQIAQADPQCLGYS